ncbi:aspartate 1-decarboxylase [Candidatus Woesearchaeota archaeon]|nr:aspartate 1-decarboxylase [Candidatus Woesearchaeota archaeon]
MMRTIMKSKLHNATITQANVNYEGSITIDKELVEKANLIGGERVQIVDLDNGERLETYVIVGERGSGVIGMNGPAALKCEKGHKVHIISYVMADDRELVEPRVIILNEGNKIKQ